MIIFVKSYAKEEFIFAHPWSQDASRNYSVWKTQEYSSYRFLLRENIEL